MKVLFCGGGEAPEDVVSGINNLGALSSEQLEEFTGLVVNYFVDPTNAENLFTALGSFAEKHGIKSMKALKGILKSLLLFFKGCLRNSLTPQQLNEDLVAIGLEDSVAKSISEIWRKNYVSLSRSAMGQILMVNKLVDVEWKFGVTASTDEMDQVGDTFLQLKLVVDKSAGGGGSRDKVALELSLSQFYKFLASMQEAKSHLDFLAAN